MKNFLSLTLALMLAFTANSFAAQSTEKAATKTEITKKAKATKTEARKNKNAQKVRKVCSQKCNVDLEKVKVCRKAKGFKKGKGDGSCITEEQKSCLKDCMKSARKSMRDAKRKRIESTSDEDKKVKRNKRAN